MAWWRKKVVFPARRAWAAVSTRVRATKTDIVRSKSSQHTALLFLHYQSGGQRRISIAFFFPFGTIPDSDKTLISEFSGAGSGGNILKLHEDVQTCGYKDVQVMFEILRTELEVSSHAPKLAKQQHKRPPSVWSSRSSSMIAAAQ
ncbi:hypothetical protein EJB05_51903, partial [Eragrostis curvula]